MSQTFNMAGGAGGGIKLASISIITPPDKTAYRPGQTFDPAGMVVQAVYDNGATATATGWTYTPSGALAEGMESVTILYTEGGVTAKAQQAVTVQKASIPVPTQSGSLTYNGGPQAPAWSGYDTAEMSLGGVTSGTNAGSYNAVFTLRDTVGTEWADGTTGDKTVAWSIQKADGSLSISPESMTLDMGTSSKVITVTRSGTGTITAQSSTPEVAGVSVSGNQVTVTGIENGEAIITVSVEEDENHTKPSSKICNVTVSLILNFADASWQQVIDACKSNTVPDQWLVGDHKNMSIDGDLYSIDIIGKNHDTYADGGTAPLTFQMHDCYAGEKNMNEEATNAGGWESCDMRNIHLQAIFNLLPNEVRSGIKEVQKKTSKGETSNKIITTRDKLFLLSEIEIFGKTKISYSGEGTQYDYYKAGNSKVKNRNGSAYTWWSRSPDSADYEYFGYVSAAGNATSQISSSLRGIAFAFCF